MKTLKSIFAIVIAAMTFGACSNELESDYKRNTVRLRSEAEAINIAVSAHNTFFSNDTRGNSTMAIAEGGVHVVKGRSSRGLSNDTLLYVVNYEDNGGFALISASPTTTALVGIAEEGNYAPEQREENANLQYYLDYVCESIGNSMSSGISIPFPPGPIGPNLPPLDSLQQTTLYTVLESKGPFIDLKWGQGEPYGRLFPNGRCGSYPVVMGMIATEFWSPGEFMAGNFYVDWEALSQHKGGDTECHESNVSVTHNVIAQLIYSIASCTPQQIQGDSIIYQHSFDDMIRGVSYNYNIMLSDRIENTDSVKILLDSYDPSDWHRKFIFALENTDIDEVHGMGEVKYCWLIDGYKTINPNSRENPELIETYFHCNWANDGNGNGYFLPTSYFNRVLHYDSSNHSFRLEPTEPITYHTAHYEILVGN